VQEDKLSQKLENLLRRYNSELSSKKTFKCSLCTKSFYSKKGRKQHQAAHRTSFPCTSCDKAFPSKCKLNEHQRSNQECQFICPTCNKLFKTEFYLKQHQRTHTSEKPFQCHVCAKTYRVKASLVVHVRNQHTGERPFPCKFCDKAYASYSILQAHIRRCHKGERNHKCGICDKAYFLKFKLEAHLRWHRGEKPHLCHKCGKKFAEKNTLRTHRCVTDDLECKTCGVEHDSIPALAKHILEKHISQLKSEGETYAINLSENYPQRSGHLLVSPSSGNNGREEVAATNKLQLECKQCQITFSTKNSYTRHMLYDARHQNDVRYFPSTGTKK